MKLSELIEDLEKLIKYCDMNLDKSIGQFIDDGEVNVNNLVERGFNWDFDDIVINHTLKESYGIMLNTLKNSDWNDTSGDNLSIKEWLNWQAERYRNLAMAGDTRSSNQHMNLVNSYKRDAFITVYEYVKRKANSKYVIEIDV